MSELPDGSELHRLSTEQSREELADLDLLSASELVALMCLDVQRVPAALDAAQPAIARAVEGIVERLERGGRLVYVGAGTAGRLGLLDAAEAGPTFNVPQGQVIGVLAGGSGAFDVPRENAEDDSAAGGRALADLAVDARDAVVGIAASGRTPYVLGALAAAAEAGALTIGLACNAATPLAAAAEIAIEVIVGPEVVAGSTRLNAGTAQKIVLNILSTAAMVRLGKTYGGLMVDLRASNAKLRDRATRIVAEITGASLERARAALEECGWQPKLASITLLGAVDPETAAGALARHGGRLRPTLAELAPARQRRPRTAGALRLGVAAALVDGVLVPGDVSLADGRIAEVGLARAGRGIAAPGLVDAQVNGYAGIDVLSADADGLLALTAALRRDGVFCFQPTLITSGERELLAALQAIAELQARPGEGAAVAGVHLEGPFLAPGRAGTHPLEHLRPPDSALLERLLAAGPVRMVTLAPELPGALELIELCRRRGITVSLGHSEASAAEAELAFAAGAEAVTHLFNAMAPLGARSPGLAGAALARAGVTLQLIADGVHVSDELLRVAFAAAPDRCSLVSDAIAAAALGDGSYRLGSVALEVRGGVARRGDGTLAGSAARLADGLATLGRLGLEPAEALRAATTRPARLLRLERAGRLAPGLPADLVLLDEGLRLTRVIAGGAELDPPPPARALA